MREGGLGFKTDFIAQTIGHAPLGLTQAAAGERAARAGALDGAEPLGQLGFEGADRAGLGLRGDLGGQQGAQGFKRVVRNQTRQQQFAQRGVEHGPA